MRNVFAIVAVLIASCIIASPSRAVNGPGALYVSGASTTPTHFNMGVGETITAEIRGVGAEVGDPLPPMLTVYIKSSEFGNAEVTATQIGATNNYTFEYTSPVEGPGTLGACATVIVAYGSLGQNASNDLIDDGILNGSTSGAAGFRFVDAFGDPVTCPLVPVTAQPWSSVKELFRR